MLSTSKLVVFREKQNLTITKGHLACRHLTVICNSGQTNLTTNDRGKHYDNGNCCWKRVVH